MLSGRKILAPLIKRIHPDLFTQESQSIRLLNLTCLQTLNELWDSLERLNVHIISNNNQIKSKQLPISFKPKYSLSCYIRNIYDNELSKIDAIVVSPVELCRKDVLLTENTMKLSMMKMNKQLGSFFTMIGLTNPWNIVENEVNQDPFDGESVSITTSQMIIDAQAFQKDIELKYRMTQATLFNTDDKNSKSSTNSSKRSKLKMMPISWHLLRGETDAFIRNGNVLVMNLSPKEEFENIDRLREFLIEYGALLNFRIDKWQLVIIIIGGTKGYSYEIKSGRHIINVPDKFKEVKLFECLRKHLPMAKLFT